jgi:hypothetical protein
VRPARGHRAHSSSGSAASDSWPVLMARLCRQQKLYGVLSRAPGKVAGGGAYPSSVQTARGQHSSERRCSSTSGVEAVTGGDPNEVLWLRGGGGVHGH